MKASKSRISFLFFILLSIIIISNCSREDTILVTRVGGRKITLKEFEIKFARGKNAEMIKGSSLEDKKKFLDGMINRQLKIIDAYQHELDKDEKIIGLVQERSRGFMFNRLIELEVTQKIMPDSELKDFYEKANKEVKIRQIVVKYDPKIPGQKQRAFTRAKEIVQKLKNRENFAKLAADVSDDINTAKKGGDKGYLKWGPRSSENPVYAAAFSMKVDEISDPIETPNGYYIIKIVHIKKYPGPPFEQEREKIRRQIYSIRSREITDAYYKYLDNLRRKYKLQFNEDGIVIFTKQFLSPKIDSLNAPKKSENPLDNFSTSDKKLIIATYKNGQLTIGDLIEELKKYPRHRQPRFQKKLEVQEFINSRLIPIHLLEQEVNAKNIKNDKTIKNQIKSFRENIMINNIQRIKINEKIEVADCNIKNYFEEHREDYKNPEKREVQQLFVIDKDLAGNLAKRARRGEDFTKLFRSYNEKESIRKNDGKLEITKGRAGIGKPSFQINLGEVTEPIKIGSGFYIVKVLNITEPTLKTFDEAKNIVSAKVRRLAYENRENEWIEELRNRINYFVYEQNLEKAFKKYTGQNIVAIE